MQITQLVEIIIVFHKSVMVSLSIVQSGSQYNQYIAQIHQLTLVSLVRMLDIRYQDDQLLSEIINICSVPLVKQKLLVIIIE